MPSTCMIEKIGHVYAELGQFYSPASIGMPHRRVYISSTACFELEVALVILTHGPGNGNLGNSCWSRLMRRNIEWLLFVFVALLLSFSTSTQAAELEEHLLLLQPRIPPFHYPLLCLPLSPLTPLPLQHLLPPRRFSNDARYERKRGK